MAAEARVENDNSPKFLVTIKDGCLGNMVGGHFRALTNWIPTVAAKVFSKGVLIGCIFEHKPENCTDSDMYRSYLTMNDISRQSTIVSKQNNKRSLFTQELSKSKENYLPDYFYSLVTAAQLNQDIPIVKPIEETGMQSEKHENFYVWVFATINSSDLLILKENFETYSVAKAEDVGLGKTKHCFNSSNVLSVDKFPLDLVTDAITSIKEAFSTVFDSNLPACHLLLGAVAMALSYPKLRSFDSVPIPIIIGTPCGGKSTAIKLALSIVGITDSLIDPTYSSIIDELCQSTIPPWWEDVEDEKGEFEKIVFMVYNKSIRTKANGPKRTCKSIPICTSNGFFLERKSGEKLKRYLERLVLIKFNDTFEEEESSYNGNYEFKDTLDNLTSKTQYLLPLLLQCGDCTDRDMRLAVDEILQKSVLTNRRDFSNYGKLLHITANIMLKMNYSAQEVREMLERFMENHLKPCLEMYTSGEKVSANDQDGMSPINNWLETMEKSLVEKYIKIHNAVRCDCGRVVSICITKLNDLSGGKLPSGAISQFRNWVRRSGNGCTGKKFNIPREPQQKCDHVKIELLSNKIKLMKEPQEDKKELPNSHMKNNIRLSSSSMNELSDDEDDDYQEDVRNSNENMNELSDDEDDDYQEDVGNSNENVSSTSSQQQKTKQRKRNTVNELSDDEDDDYQEDVGNSNENDSSTSSQQQKTKQRKRNTEVQQLKFSFFAKEEAPLGKRRK